ncbi:hypothetical protein AX17_004909 [Amanita inopinata Kibby_2008]|nr:hypothetical protein AX17_004909 [Amanita inopinata Kibby_2008]
MQKKGILYCLVPSLAAVVHSANTRVLRAVPGGISLTYDPASTSYPTQTISPLSPLPSPPPPPPPSPSPTNVTFYFNSIPQIVTCGTATFSWNYTGPPAQQFILSITNIGVNQDSAHASPTLVNHARPQAPTNTINVVISRSIDASADVYTWSSVAVPRGWYKLSANLPSSSSSSPITSTQFLVGVGPDTSCLGSGTPSGTGALSTDSVNVGAIVGGALGGAALIFGAALLYSLILKSQHRSTQTPPDRRGPAFGSGRTPSSGSPQHDSKKGSFFKRGLFSQKGWDGLGSVDSHINANPGGTAASIKSNHRHHHHHQHRRSRGSISRHNSFPESLNLPSLEYNHRASKRTLGEEEKMTDSPTSTLSYKIPVEDAAGSPDVFADHDAALDNPPLRRLSQPQQQQQQWDDAHGRPERAHVRQSRSASRGDRVPVDKSQSIASVDSLAMPGTTASDYVSTHSSGAASAPVSRPSSKFGKSQPELGLGLGLWGVGEPSDSPQRSPVMDSPPLNVTSSTSSPTSPASPTSAPASSSAKRPQSAPARKTPRKPVPAYDPSIDPDYLSALTTPSSSYNAASPLSGYRPSSSSSSSPGTHHPLYSEDPFARTVTSFGGSTSGHGHGHGGGHGGGGHYLARTQSHPAMDGSTNGAGSGEDGGRRELAHKHSLGLEVGKPVHYLIPDMPLPQSK